MDPVMKRNNFSFLFIFVKWLRFVCKHCGYASKFLFCTKYMYLVIVIFACSTLYIDLKCNTFCGCQIAVCANGDTYLIQIHITFHIFLFIFYNQYFIMSVYHQDKVLIFVVKSNVIPKLEMLFKKKRKKERKKKKNCIGNFSYFCYRKYDLQTNQKYP